MDIPHVPKSVITLMEFSVRRGPNTWKPLFIAIPSIKAEAKLEGHVSSPRTFFSLKRESFDQLF